MPDGYLISVGARADFSELKAEQKVAQEAVRQAAENMKQAYAEFGTSAAAGSLQAVEALKVYEAELTQAQARAAAAGAAMANAMTATGSATAATVPQFVAANAAMRVMEGNFLNNARGASRFLTSTLGLGPALQAAFPVIGAAALAGVLVEMAERGYDLYERFISIDAVWNKLAEDVMKMQGRDFINVHSIETATLRLDQANTAATNLRETAESLHKSGTFDLVEGLLSGNTGGIAAALAQLTAGHGAAEGSAQRTEQSIALQIKQLELQHELNVAKIEAAHSADSALSPERKISGEYEKRIALAKEEQEYTRQRERTMGNPTPAGAGDTALKLQEQIAGGEAFAQRLELNKKAVAEFVSESIAQYKDGAKEQERITTEVNAEGVRLLKEQTEEEKLVQGVAREHAEDINARILAQKEAAAESEKSATVEIEAAAKVAEAKVQYELASGAITQEAAAHALAAIHAKQYGDQIKALEEELRALKAVDDWSPGSKKQQGEIGNQITALQGDQSAALITGAAKQADAFEKPWLKAFNTMATQWMRVQDEMLRGQVSIANGMKRMASEMLLDTVHNYEQMILQALRHRIMEVAATEVGEEQKTAATAQGAAAEGND